MMHSNDFYTVSDGPQGQTASKISLTFPNLHQLWSFVTASKITTVEIHTGALNLVCSCSEEQIRLAIEKYHARIVDG